MEFFTGDLHGEWDIAKLKSSKDNEFTRDDDLFISGDFGLIWNFKEEKTCKFWRDWLTNKKYRIFFVPGNHENYDRLFSDEFPEIDMFGGKVRYISKNIFMLQTGYVYTIKDKKIFAFGGAQSIDKINRINHITWWEQEIPSASEFFRGMKKLEEVNFDVDIVISHATHSDMFKRIKPIIDKKVIDDNKENGYEIVGLLDKMEDPLLKMLQEFKERLTYKLWVCGHYHNNCFSSEEKTAILYNLVIPYDKLKAIVDNGKDNFFLQKV